MIKIFIKYLLLSSLLAGVANASDIYISYDGKPMKLFAGQVEKVISIYNGEDVPVEFSARVITPNATFDVGNNNYLAVEWLRIMPKGQLVKPKEKSFFTLSAYPYEYLSEKEFYADILIKSKYSEHRLPLVLVNREYIRMNDVVTYNVVENMGASIFVVKNIGDYHSILDLSYSYSIKNISDRITINKYNDYILYPNQSINVDHSIEFSDQKFDVKYIMKVDRRKVYTVTVDAKSNM